MGISDNLTKYRGITHNGLVPHAGGVAILPAAYQMVGVWKGRSEWFTLQDTVECIYSCSI